MKARGDHRLGQLRAELFEELTYALVRKIYPTAEIERDAFVTLNTKTPTTISVDFVIREAERSVLIQSRAPYRATATPGIKRTLRDLKKFYMKYPERSTVTRVVLALSCDLPAGALRETEETRSYFAQHNVTLDIWESNDVWSRLAQRLDIRMRDFTVPALQQALGIAPATPETLEGSSSALSGFADEQREVIVLAADFCSFSRFVHASGSDEELVKSIMGRFYRTARKLIATHNGILDKFIGDGVLAYFIPSDSVARDVEHCVRALIGFAIKLAGEWQERVDMAVAPKGMRIGAAIGDVYFISENPDTPFPVHAIGESVNVAARLQALAEANTLVISNRLKTRFYEDRAEFIELPPASLKNIGEVLAWQYSFESHGGA